MTVPSLDREFGGPVGKARSLAGALRARGYDVVLVGAGDPDGDRTVGLGRRGSFHATPIPRRLHPLRRLTSGADVVHVIGFRDPVGTVAANEAAGRDVVRHLLSQAVCTANSALGRRNVVIVAPRVEL
jgi:hypothetical protein